MTSLETCSTKPVEVTDNDLPVPREQLYQLGLSDGQIEDALSRAPLVRGFRPEAASRPVEFRADRALKAIKAVGAMSHTKGRKFAATRIVLEPWQIVWIFAPVFGWVYQDDGTRVCRELYVEIPRKNGKSTIATCIALVLLAADQEPGAEIYAAASDRSQASRIIEDAKSMVLQSPPLRKRVKVQAAMLRGQKNSFMRALSRAAEAAHGLNVHGAVIDELHVHKKRDLVDAMLTGTGSRDQPLAVIITTADLGSDHSIYQEFHQRARHQADGTIQDPAFMGMVWAAEEGDDPFAEETIKKANPNYGVSLFPESVRTEIRKAKDAPSSLPSYLQLRLNLRQKATAGLIRREDWAHPDQIQMLPDLTGRTCFGAFDLSAVSDFTAGALWFPPADIDDPDEPWYLVTKSWLPEDHADRLQSATRAPLNKWAKDGWLSLTEGNVLDYDPVIRWFDDAARRYDLAWVGYDRWNAGSTVNKLIEKGLNLEPVGQGYKSMTPAIRMFERLVLNRQVVHGGDPCLAWQVNCLEVKRDESDNVRPVKPDRGKSMSRIDAVVAALTGLFGVHTYASQHTESAYEDRGLMVI